ncbi:GFA family protein [Vibrio sp. LaRot3]|uniref:GFA family protein n=1 Tax=Vibrio sp. LaRot3 TaxID=2998829 RepID=UPI0022CDC742|nr:GFA family protein [Vibrio sp. LaRot3]MDA0147665.1 GFA family protein [Vibrio sp. LaRot3]
MERTQYNASCLCGKVSLKVKPKSNHFMACHCHTCQKWTGGPQLAIPCGTEVEFEGQEYITEFASSGWATRGFCTQCGSHLFYKLNHNGEYNILVGLLDIDKQAQLELAIQYFIDLKPTFYSLDADCQTMTEAEVIKAFTS